MTTSTLCPMSGSTQRRLTAIVSADVVGYSRLMGLDETGTHARLQSRYSSLIEPMISAHGGRVVKLMGDGLLAEFLSVVDAVSWAVEVQTKVAELDTDRPDDQRIDYRVGVNLGDVIVDGDDIFGDGVNVAARLQEMAEPGGVCISAKVHAEVRGKLTANFTDGGAQTAKNIAQPIQIWRWSPFDGKPVEYSGAGEGAEQEAPLPLPDKPSIAVLPFDNMSGDPEQEYFADGITEDIITELSRFREFLVIARNSTFVYKGAAKDLTAVARELNARYVVEGSVRKAGNRVRVTAQLIEGDTNTHLWADRFDGDLTDIFTLQDEITSAIVSAVAPRSVQAEAERSAKLSATQLSAWDSLLRGRVLLAALDKEGVREAVPLLRTALRQDPRNAQAHSWLAYALFASSSYGWSDDPVSDRDEATVLAREAVSLGPDDALSHVVSGVIASDTPNGVEAARRAFEKALQINPNFAMAHGCMGGCQAILGDFAAARKHLDLAARLSPLDPGAVIWQALYNMGLYGAERYEDVVKGAGEAMRTNPDYPGFYRHRAAALAMLGRIEEARDDIKQVLRLVPGFTIERARHLPFWPDIEPFLNGLRKAGLPEE
ncbi:MAG: adenylate/guanylate cyclase domain-containing protein [Alphaproteobacteria bacterium]|nr:adenylate/guanylate cyclase domain-containing protein [Alphaproteobacteria bacterium]